MKLAVSVLGLISLAALAWLFLPAQVSDVTFSSSAEEISRGQYLVHAAGCVSCHLSEDNPPALSGGHALVSDFGTFYVPNITPDLETGIGQWAGKDFLLAVKHGRNPDGGFYFPAFPFRAYAGMANEDAMSIAAYLMAQPAVNAVNKPHQLQPWIASWMMAVWNRIADLNDAEYPAYQDPEIKRGAYLARNLGHCGECHTPRNSLGILDAEREFAGAITGESEADPIDQASLASWSKETFAFFLFLGVKPDDEYVGGKMEAVIEHNTSPLTDADRKALAAFFLRAPD